MKYFILYVILIIPFISSSQEYCDFVQKVQNYQDSVKLETSGEFDIIDSNTFDILTYLSFFEKIKIDKEINIDVYYFDNFLDGKPYLYAKKGNKIITDKDVKTLFKLLNKPDYRAKNYIKPKDSEIGFLQYLFFNEMGEQFALKWHSNYNEKYIICSMQELEKVINELKNCNQTQTGKKEVETPAFKVDLQELEKVSKINPAIEIEMTNDFYLISWIENRTHKGIYKCKYKIQRHSPYKIEKTNEEQLLKTKLGFLY